MDLVDSRGFSEVELNETLQSVYSDIEPERLRERLLPDQPANTAITIDVIVVDELGGADDEFSDGTRGLSPEASTGLLTVGVLALLAGMLIRRRRLA